MKNSFECPNPACQATPKEDELAFMQFCWVKGKISSPPLERNAIIRVRECQTCKTQFTTYEVTEQTLKSWPSK